MAHQEIDRHAVFLNLPYDNNFVRQSLAYIAAVSSFGLVPYVVVGLQGNTRLSLIADLIAKCQYSIHDLSRTKRFNMPFELGFTMGWHWSNPSHRWLVFAPKRNWVDKSLTDIKGIDVYAHEGTITGIMCEIGNAFVNRVRQPSVLEMMRIYRALQGAAPAIQRKTGSKTFFTASFFSELSASAAALAEKYITS
jgi:hypothetical protein